MSRMSECNCTAIRNPRCHKCIGPEAELTSRDSESGVPLKIFDQTSLLLLLLLLHEVNSIGLSLCFRADAPAPPPCGLGFRVILSLDKGGGSPPTFKNDKNSKPLPLKRDLSIAQTQLCFYVPVPHQYGSATSRIKTKSKHHGSATSLPCPPCGRLLKAHWI